MATCFRLTIEDVNARLLELGFPRHIIETTVEVWAGGVNSVTPLHPRNFGGLVGWGESVRTLREEGIPYGLEPHIEESVEMCICRASSVGVVIAQGNAATGDRLRDPTTKYPRGPNSREVLTVQPMLPFMSPAFDQVEEQAQYSRFNIWLLLTHMSGSEIRAELSLPRLIDADGVIQRWRERILFPPMQLGIPRGGRGGTGDPGMGDEVDVPVMRRR